MKKTVFIAILTVLMCVALCACLVACGEKNNSETPKVEKPDVELEKLPTASTLVTARTNAKNANEQNYDFYLNLAGTIEALGITETANANYDGKYRFNAETGNLKFRRQTSGILLVDSTEYIYTRNNAKIKVVSNEKGEVKKSSVLPKEDEGLDLINMPFVALVNGLKEENISKIELSGKTDYKYVATFCFKRTTVSYPDFSVSLKNSERK